MQRLILAIFFVLFASTTCFADSIDDLNAAIRAMKGNQTHTAKQLLAKVIQDINSVLPGFPWVAPVRNWPGRGPDHHRRSRWLS